MMTMTTQLTVSTEIAATPDTVWALVSDLSKMGEWSPETDGVEWLRGATGPVPGATFKGSNHHGSKKWTTIGKITEADPGSRFAFRITAAGFKISEWRYDIEPAGSGCRVTETWVDERGALARTIGRLTTGIADRGSHNRATMQTKLEGLKASAESAPSPG